MPSKPAAKSSSKRWSKHVTETSNALDLDSGVFTWSDPKRIARSLKKSAEASKRRKSSPAQSAMSMLNFYINRAGHNLPAKQLNILKKSKDELHKLFEKPGTARETARRKPAVRTGSRKAAGAKSKRGARSKS